MKTEGKTADRHGMFARRNAEYEDAKRRIGPQWPAGGWFVEVK